MRADKQNESERWERWLRTQTHSRRSSMQLHFSLSNWNRGGGDADDKVTLYLLQEETERGRERDWGNWCFRVVILSVVPRILQQGPGSYIIPPLSHTHTHSYSLLWHNTLLLSNIVQHRAALPAFINRAMQAQRSLDSAASRTAEALRELVGRLVVLVSWEWLTFRYASENETNRNKHFLGGQIENIFKFFQKMKICNLLGIEMQVN